MSSHGANSHMDSLTVIDERGIRGYLHEPSGQPAGALVLTHGAGGNSKAPLLVAIANTFSGQGWRVLRCDLPFRQARPFGPPSPAHAAKDQQGLRDALNFLRSIAKGPVCLGGQSYGGRQSSMLAASDPEIAAALLLLSYPLHAPGKPNQLRKDHFPDLRIPALFVEGDKDPFGSIEEISDAIKLIPATTELRVVPGVGHDLGRGKVLLDDLPSRLARLAGRSAAASRDQENS